MYPLRFEPIYHYRIWGGNKLKHLLNKKGATEHAGESWEISGLEHNETRVASGVFQGLTLRELCDQHGPELLGEQAYARYGNEFPLLIKFIDAAEPLSIQVHPDDTLSRKRHQASGKNEMWYIMQADKDASLIMGFKEKLSPRTYERLLEKGAIESYLNEVPVREGDVFYIPSGRVHSIGKGILLAEIQQASDITYRIYDFDRVDAASGKKRALHTAQALEAIDFDPLTEFQTTYTAQPNEKTSILDTVHFKTELITLDGKMSMDQSDEDAFKIWIGVQGNCFVQWEEEQFSLDRGETLLIPAALDRLTLSGQEAKILEVTL
ncbi:type I phosphomannose isomerase catalytic subunit [Croceiramulus getboli]|nr:mannose-6-phosphate isomerase [Flavobacteriaceae bacterium YJPT1-3]